MLFGERITRTLQIEICIKKDEDSGISEVRRISFLCTLAFTTTQAQFMQTKFSYQRKQQNKRQFSMTYVRAYVVCVVSADFDILISVMKHEFPC